MEESRHDGRETAAAGLLRSSAAAIQAACSASGVSAGPQQFATLARYVELLQRWNATYNLSALRDRDAVLTHHIADCLALVNPILRSAPGARRILDVGSGGGLPGVVIAVVMPGLKVTCIDAVGKKVAFVRQVGGALGLHNLTAVHARVEALREPQYDLIVSRAFAPLADFARLTAHLLTPSGLWVAMKGKVPEAEIAAAMRSGKDAPEVFHVEQLDVPSLSAERCLVWMRRRSDDLI